MPYPSEVPKWGALDVQVCTDCGFGFVPKIDFDLGKYYAEEYGKTPRRQKIRINRARWHAKIIRRIKGPLTKVLDIGAGPGYFLQYVDCKEKFAIEYDSFSIPLLESKGVRLLSSIDEASEMDAIIMSHSLEHFMVDEYQEAIAKIVAGLASGGLLLIEVPNSGRLDMHPARGNGRGHEPHTLFFSSDALFRLVTIPLVYFQEKDRIFRVRNGKVNWDAWRLKPANPSQLIGIWRKPLDSSKTKKVIRARWHAKVLKYIAGSLKICSGYWRRFRFFSALGGL